MRGPFRWPAVLIASALAGCIIPPNLQQAVPESHFKASCVCYACEAGFDVQRGECRELPVPYSMPLFECAKNTEELQVEGLLRAVCKQMEKPGTSNCTLELIDGPDEDGSKFVAFSLENACPQSMASSLRGRPGGSTIDLDPSTSRIEIVSRAASSSFPVQGKIGFAGGNCRSAACPFTIEWMTLAAPLMPFTVPNGPRIDATAGYVFNAAPVGGTFTPQGAGPLPLSGGLFFPTGSLRLVMSGTAQGVRRGLVFSNPDDIARGTLSSDRKFTFVATTSVGDATLNITLAGKVNYFLPRIVLTKPQVTVGFLGGVRVHVKAAIDDLDGGSLIQTWFVDGKPVESAGREWTGSLEPGPHKIELLVSQAEGGSSLVSETVEVPTQSRVRLWLILGLLFIVVLLVWAWRKRL